MMYALSFIKKTRKTTGAEECNYAFTPFFICTKQIPIIAQERDPHTHTHTLSGGVVTIERLVFSMNVFFLFLFLFKFEYFGLS